MKKYEKTLILMLALLFVACGERGDRRGGNQGERAAAPERLCTAAVEGQETVPLYAKQGGGEVQENLRPGTKVTVIRPEKGWRLVRVTETRRSGWLDERNTTACPQKRAGGAEPAGKAPTR